jgi:hypothetical protein
MDSKSKQGIKRTPMKGGAPATVNVADEAMKARRKFLAGAGKFAVATPPAVSMLLASANRNYAAAQSGNGGGGGNGHGRHGNNGFGNGGGDGVPGRSGKSDKHR